MFQKATANKSNKKERIPKNWRFFLQEMTKIPVRQNTPRKQATVSKKALQTPRISEEQEESQRNKKNLRGTRRIREERDSYTKNLRETRFIDPRILPTTGIDETKSSRMEKMTSRITTIQKSRKKAGSRKTKSSHMDGNTLNLPL